jgi:hypothetical protein
VRPQSIPEFLLEFYLSRVRRIPRVVKGSLRVNEQGQIEVKPLDPKLVGGG